MTANEPETYYIHLYTFIYGKIGNFRKCFIFGNLGKDKFYLKICHINFSTLVNFEY